MKITIGFIVLMIIFAISTVNCNVDAADTPSCSNCSVYPQSELYTDEEQEQIRQNLVGTYQNIINNDTIIFDLRSNGTIYITTNTNNTQRIIYYGTSLYFRNQAKLIVSRLNKDDSNYYAIEFSPNSHTQVIGFYSIPIGTNTEIYFHKIESHGVTPRPEVSQFHRYTDEEIMQLRENLVGILSRHFY